MPIIFLLPPKNNDQMEAVNPLLHKALFPGKWVWCRHPTNIHLLVAKSPSLSVLTSNREPWSMVIIVFIPASTQEVV